ncbi:DUF3606 domain-containing protein [Bordetella sputigena]|uniref:DUF3606 domain-containing protein n=1 Tax=Bordetella sputigena TaxID=1416810 RepID=UPI0039EF58A7
MPDNLQKRGPADASRVNVNEPWELSYWCGKFNVTPDQLRAAVRAVGVMVKDVQRHLGR